MKQFRTTVLDAIMLLKQAWDEVASVTVANCFMHSGFVCDTTEEADNLDKDMYDQDYEEVVEGLDSLLPQDNAEDILNECVLVDEDVLTCAELTDNELAEIVHNEDFQDIPAGSAEDEDDMEIVEPSYREVAKALGTKDYLLFISDNQPAFDRVEKH